MVDQTVADAHALGVVRAGVLVHETHQATHGRVADDQHQDVHGRRAVLDVHLAGGHHAEESAGKPVLEHDEARRGEVAEHRPAAGEAHRREKQFAHLAIIRIIDGQRVSVAVEVAREGFVLSEADPDIWIIFADADVSCQDEIGRRVTLTSIQTLRILLVIPLRADQLKDRARAAADGRRAGVHD